MKILYILLPSKISTNNKYDGQNSSANSITGLSIKKA